MMSCYIYIEEDREPVYHNVTACCRLLGYIQQMDWPDEEALTYADAMMSNGYLPLHKLGSYNPGLLRRVVRMLYTAAVAEPELTDTPDILWHDKLGAELAEVFPQLLDGLL